MNIFVIDKELKKNVGIIDFIPRKEDRIILNNKYGNVEYKVQCVVYHPKENAILVFVNAVENYYEKIINEIDWK